MFLTFPWKVYTNLRGIATNLGKIFGVLPTFQPIRISMLMYGSEQSERVIVTTRSHLTTSVTDALDALKSKGLLDRVEKVGGAGYKVNTSSVKGFHQFLLHDVFLPAKCPHCWFKT